VRPGTCHSMRIPESKGNPTSVRLHSPKKVTYPPLTKPVTRPIVCSFVEREIDSYGVL
jgi:hypothetical protein